MRRVVFVALLLVFAGAAAAETGWTRAGWYRIEIFPTLALQGGPFASEKACGKTLPKVEDDVVKCAHLKKAGDEIDVALAFFADAIKANPRDAAAMNYRGLLFARRGEYQKAIAEHTEAIKADPDDYWGFVFRGTAYQKLGKKAQAEADFREALARHPGDEQTVAKLKAQLRELGVEP
ncbi:MAG: tetratricopeptide repeat protein [Alphaproteobacteria bacterium]|nr:tetratricopeptide repeat protein [Alphaproteobacteria bacterium]